MKGLFILLAVTLAMSGCSSKINTQDTQATSDVQSIDRQVSSTFNKTVVWNKGQKFWNVIGSTNDPKIDNQSWIAVYRAKCGIDPGKNSATGATCSQNALGGHVVKNGQSQSPAKNSSVYIIPICTSENNSPSTEMTVAPNSICVVELNYWMQ
ncbi:hypothetical protein [Rahnella sp. AA]|uniref:hypothetical protein n=1 Tax=Rahnella sp. AA TaxID=2057180 RepID=UPI0012FEA919|nr:hypothetical protein [Rahnella sp. AA]